MFDLQWKSQLAMMLRFVQCAYTVFNKVYALSFNWATNQRDGIGVYKDLKAIGALYP